MIDICRGEFGAKPDWLVLLARGFTVGLDVGLVEELLSSSVSEFLLLLEHLLKFECERRDGLGGGLAGTAGVCLLFGEVDLIVQSLLLPLLARRTMSLEETIRWVFGSDGFLFSGETLDGCLLSSGLWSSESLSLFSL